MNGFEKHGLDDDAFGPSSSLASGLMTFDAFPKTKKTYTTASSRGGQWTVVIALFCVFLTINEFISWWAGVETHHFSVERGISQELQVNLDIVVAMPCQDLHMNVQDAAMDRIIAGDLLSKDDTTWDVWIRRPPTREKGSYNTLNEATDLKRKRAEEEDSHVGHVLGHMREGGRKFVKTPKLKRYETANACRIYGSLEGNKVQGDFHITARGHGYMDMGPGMLQHLDHGTFNFSHHINELSFGPHFPNLLNPLDHTSDTTPHHFYKFQYYLSIVPTIFTKRRVSTATGILDPAAIPQPPTLDLQPELKKKKKKRDSDDHSEIHHVANPSLGSDRKSVFTNQYAATSQSRQVAESQIPGVYFKFDIEPILLIVSEQRSSFLALVVRLVNVMSGVLVGGGWLYSLTEWLTEVVGRRRRRSSMGVLHGRSDSKGE